MDGKVDEAAVAAFSGSVISITDRLAETHQLDDSSVIFI